MRVRGIHEKIHGLLFGRAQDKSVMGGDNVVLIGQATICTIIEERTGAWPDILALMAFAARTLANEVAAMLAEIITPGV
jgi:hypothetical protein